MTACIYKITNTKNNKIYIGQTVDYDNRMYEHFNKSNCTGRKFKNAIKKYGKEFFVYEILEEINKNLNIGTLKKKLCEREQYYFDVLQPFDEKGYNIQRHAEKSNLGTKLNDDIKKKISEGLKKYHRTHDNAFKGRKHTKESRKKISKNRKGIFHTKESKRKLSETHKRINSIEILQKWVDKNGHPRLTPIIQLHKDESLIRIFRSIKEAAECTGIKRTNITNCLRKYSMSAGGYKWSYLNQNNK